jgi:hypothetical protein
MKKGQLLQIIKDVCSIKLDVLLNNDRTIVSN